MLERHSIKARYAWIRKSKLAVATIVGAVTLGMAPAAQAVPEFFAGTGHFYDFIDCGLCTWDFALADAATKTHDPGSGPLQGYMATINSAAEHTFIVSEIFTVGFGGWLAGSDAAVEGEWRWVTGPEAGEIFWTGGPGGSSPTFASWQPGAPGNAGGDEDVVFGPVTWNNIEADILVGGYFIEYGGLEDAAVPEPATLALLGFGVAGLGWLRRRKTRTI